MFPARRRRVLSPGASSPHTPLTRFTPVFCCRFQRYPKCSLRWKNFLELNGKLRVAGCLRCKNTFNAVHMQRLCQSILLDRDFQVEVWLFTDLQLTVARPCHRPESSPTLERFTYIEGWVFYVDGALSKPYTWVELQSLLRKGAALSPKV